MLNFDDRPKERWAFLRQKQSKGKLAIFVHGFRGDYLSTWGALPDLLYQHADTMQPFSDWDYVFLGYPTFDIDSYLDIAEVLATQVDRALNGKGPYRPAYTQFALLGHSLGTLGIRQFLCSSALTDPPMVKAVTSVTLFGTPGEGSYLASLVTPIYAAARSLEPKNPQLRMLKTWTSGARAVAQWPEPRLVIGKGDWVVGGQAVLFAGDNKNKVTFLSLGHRALVKPDSWPKSVVVEMVSEALV